MFFNNRATTRFGKSVKKEGFEKKCLEKSGNLTKFEKRQILSVKIYKAHYFPKPSNSNK